MLNLPLHPIFLGPFEKLFYRLVANDILDFKGRTAEIVLAKMHKWTHQRDWTQYVPNEGRFVAILQKIANVSDDV